MPTGEKVVTKLLSVMFDTFDQIRMIFRDQVHAAKWPANNQGKYTKEPDESPEFNVCDFM